MNVTVNPINVVTVRGVGTSANLVVKGTTTFLGGAAQQQSFNNVFGAPGRIITTVQSGNLTIDLANTSVTAGAYGSASAIPNITVDSYGRITSISTSSVSTSFNLSADSGTGAVTGGQTLGVSGGTGISTSVTGNTFSIVNTGAVPTVNLNSISSLTSVTYTTSTTAQTAIDTFSTTSYRTAKYEVQLSSGTSYHVIDLRVIHDGTNVYMTQYNEVYTASSLGIFDAAIAGTTLSLLLTPTNASTTIKLFRNLIPI